MDEVRVLQQFYLNQLLLLQVRCEFIRCSLERVVIPIKSKSMGPEWRRRGSRLTSQHTSRWTVEKPVKVSIYKEMVWELQKHF